MLRLAMLSIVRDRPGVGPTALIVLAGVALLSGMAGVAATGLVETTPDADRAFLVQFPAILGSWILAIVVFAVVSTVGVGLDGRRNEIRGLRLIGATPGQVRMMIAAETAAVSLIASIPGVLLGYPVGAGIVRMTASTGVITGAAPYSPGPILPIVAALVVVSAAAIGGFAGSREAAERSPVGEAAAERRTRSSRPRRVAALVLVAVGLGTSATAITMSADSVYATATTGPGCVLVAIGTAIFAPELLRIADRSLGVALRLLGGSSGRLAAINLSVAPSRIRPAVTFSILFVGVAAGTLSMQAIENQSAGSAAGIGRLMATINYLVVLLIAAFMSIALVNNLIASIRQRRSELTVMSSVGATVAQSTRMLVIETSIASVVAIVTALIGSIAVVIPFAILKTGSASSAVQGLPLVGVSAAAAMVAILTTVLVGRRTATEARAGR